MLVLAFIFVVFAWATFRLSNSRDRLECAGGIAHGQCVLTHRDAYDRDVRIRSFAANTLMTVHVVEESQPQQSETSKATNAHLVIVFQDASFVQMPQQPLSQALQDQAHIRAFINTHHDHASFDTGDRRWLRIASLFSIVAVALILRVSWIRFGRVQLRWHRDSHTLEVIEPAFLRTHHTRFEVPHDARFVLHWKSVSNNRGPKCLASLAMQHNPTTHVQLTRPRADGVGVHYQGLLDLLRLMDHAVPKPLEAPVAPTSPPSPTFESWLGSLWLGLSCGSLIGLFSFLMVGLELNILTLHPFSYGPALMLGGVFGFVATTALLRLAAKSRRNDFDLYKSLTSR